MKKLSIRHNVGFCLKLYSIDWQTFCSSSLHKIPFFLLIKHTVFGIFLLLINMVGYTRFFRRRKYGNSNSFQPLILNVLLMMMLFTWVVIINMGAGCRICIYMKYFFPSAYVSTIPYKEESYLPLPSPLIVP